MNPQFSAFQRFRISAFSRCNAVRLVKKHFPPPSPYPEENPRLPIPRSHELNCNFFHAGLSIRIETFDLPIFTPKISPRKSPLHHHPFRGDP
ncbi:hypothetical protein KJ815_00255, partial [bacterium]|nr:hypothetical protein [bacterium]